MAYILKTPKLELPEGIWQSIFKSQVKLAPIIQSEVSQKEKHKYRILTHIYGI